jgi:hypothetical protein
MKKSFGKKMKKNKTTNLVDICHKNHKIYPMTVENKSCACDHYSQYSNRFKCLCYYIDENEIKFLPEYSKKDFKII